MKPMSAETRLLSVITLFLAVLLPSLVLLFLGNKNLARILFVAVLVIGYGYIYIRWRRERGRGA